MSDAANDAIRKWSKRGNKSTTIMFVIEDGEWVVESISKHKDAEDKTISPEDQLATTVESLTGDRKYDSRVFLAKIEYEKGGAQKDAIVYCLRRGLKSKKKSMKQSNAQRMVYAMSGKIIKDQVQIKHSHEYDKAECTYEQLAHELSTKI